MVAEQELSQMKLSEMGLGLTAGDILCGLEDIADGAAKELSYRSGDAIHDIFLQRKGEEVFAFKNICPHAGTPLNMDDGRFMEKTGTYLMCHTHGALFQLHDGLCVAGPCNGASLQALDIIVENGNVIVV